MGILINTGFDVGSSNPIDSRTVKNTTDERDALISDGLVYENLKVYCKDTQTEYRWTGTEWEEVGTGGTVDLSGYAKTYTSLAELELTSSATINEVISKLNPGDVFTCTVTSFSSYQTMFPYFDSDDSDAYVFIHRGRTPVMSYAKWYKRDSSSEALAYFNKLTGYIEGWTTFATKKTYTTLTDLELTADATITQVVNAMLEGESFRSIVTRFNNYQTMFPYEEEEDQNAYVLINKLNGNAVYVAWYRIDGTKHYIGHYINNTLQNWINYSPTSDLSEYTKTFTSLNALGLTADATFQDVVDTLPKGGSALLGVTEFTNYQTIFPYEEGNDQFARVHIVKGAEDGSRVYARWFRKDGVKEAIAIFNINDNTFGGWQILKNQQIYTSLNELGLDTTATINDIVGAMKDGTTFTYKTDVFDYATEYNNIQHGTVTIDKQSTARVQVLMTDKNTGNLYVGRMDTNNLFVGWRNCSFHRIVTQATAGYFKFKPTSDGGFEQPLRISATDNYGGMIEISGNAPTQTQYKPFKCVRLSHGTYTDYNASNPANNKMEKLFFLDGYMYLKIASYTTTTFTGLVGAPTYVETIDETAAVEIPIVSIIATQYDAYGDPYIVTIGETVSSDGSIQTLASLGLSTDIMTWKTGIYKVSHVSGLTGLPSDIINTSPGFRLEHHNIKKWGGGHAPYRDTWGQRHSIIYCDNGNVYHRFHESGATAGTYIKDTGWQKIQTSGEYNSINKLNSAKGTSIELVKGEDNTQKIMDALGVGDSFVSLYHNESSNNRFGIPASVGGRITKLHIEKLLDANGTSNYCVATAFMNTGVVLNRTNYGGTLSDWCYGKTYSTTEQAVGTWIDGSTVYRKTFTATNPVTNPGNFTINVASGVKRIISGSGSITVDSGTYSVPFVTSSGTGIGSYANFNLDTNGNIYVNGASSKVTDINVTVEYIKN